MSSLAQPKRRLLVVDANVVGHASRKSFDTQSSNAIEVLCKIYRVCHKIAVDYSQDNQNNIVNEYDRQTTTDFTRRWLTAMNRKKKVVMKYRSHNKIQACTHQNDQKYFQVALNTTPKIIISEDRHFTEIKDAQEVTNNGIKIWKFADALSNL